MDESPWQFYLTQLGRLRARLAERHPGVLADVEGFIRSMEEDASDQLLIERDEAVQ